MATAKKLPSGSWRCLVYDYTDTSGKRHYKSFTSSAPTPKDLQLSAPYAAPKYVGWKIRTLTETLFISKEQLF